MSCSSKIPKSGFMCINLKLNFETSWELIMLITSSSN